MLFRSWTVASVGWSVRGVCGLSCLLERRRLSRTVSASCIFAASMGVSGGEGCPEGHPKGKRPPHHQPVQGEAPHQFRPVWCYLGFIFLQKIQMGEGWVTLDEVKNRLKCLFSVCSTVPALQSTRTQVWSFVQSVRASWDGRTQLLSSC